MADPRYLGLHHPSSQYPYGTIHYQARHAELCVADLGDVTSRVVRDILKPKRPKPNGLAR